MVIYRDRDCAGALSVQARKIASLPHPKTEHKVLQITVYSLLRQALIQHIQKSQTRRRRFALSVLSVMTFGLTLLGDLPDLFEGSRPIFKHTILNGSGVAIAQQVSPQLRQDFLSDPLTTAPRDPLLPEPEVERPLSPLELSALSDELAQLNQSAQALLAAGETQRAFELWRRELRLRRVLGPVEEFAAIQRVADLAWRNQRPVDIQLLTLRMREIWETVQAALGLEPEVEQFAQQPADESAPARLLASGSNASDIAVLGAIAQTFRTLRDMDSSVEVYSQLIELSERQGIDSTEKRRSLAELHLNWFQFAQAADVYLALLQTARANNNQAQEMRYLEQLVYSYQQADSFENAIRAQTDLIAIYQARDEAEKLPELLLAIAKNYRTLNRLSNAIEYYRSAYSAAQRFEQFSFSAQVLRDLGALYQSIALTDEALGAYNLLIPVEQQAYNSYGVMNAYGNIGILQRQKGDLLEALKAFERALVIANQLNLQEDYFIEQIESVTQPSP